VLGEEDRLLHRRVAATDDTDVLPLNEEAVAGGARRDAVAHLTLLVREAMELRRRPRGDHECRGEVLVVPQAGAERARREVHRRDVAEGEARAEARRLPLEHLHHLGAEDPVGKAGVVLDVRGDGELPAGLTALDHEWLEVRARGVERGGEPGRPRAEDEHPMGVRHGGRGTIGAVPRWGNREHAWASAGTFAPGRYGRARARAESSAVARGTALAARQRAMSARNRIHEIAQRLVVAAVLLGGAAARAAGPGRAPMVIRGAGPLRPVLAAGEEKLDTRLRALVAPPAPGPSQLVPVPPPGVRGSKAHVYVRVDATDAAGLARLAGAGLRVDHVDAERGLVRSVSPVRPGFLRAGTVDTQGDAAAKAPEARASCAGCDGSGIMVGVISDGIDHVAQSISTGNLPPGTGVPAGVGCAAGSGDEGTAMLEIVHDLAPGATLLFSEGLSDKVQFIDSLTCLKNAGARVIVDDIGFFDEPFFEDGPVAQAVRAVVQGGVSYHSAAGNEADIHYGALFRAA